MRRSKRSGLIGNARGRAATARSSDQEVMRHLCAPRFSKITNGLSAKPRVCRLIFETRFMVAGTPWKRGSRFTRVNSGSFQQGSRRMLKAQTDASREPKLDKAHRYLVCRTLRKCSAGVRRGSYSWFSRDRRSDAQEPDKGTFRDHYPAAPRMGYKTDWKQLERAYFRTCVYRPTVIARCCGC